jgi:decaprenyl-phosphate phosphoribosyltransferase
VSIDLTVNLPADLGGSVRGEHPRPVFVRPRGSVAVLTGLLKTSRPKQWVKNVLVLAAPAAAGALTNPLAAGKAGEALLLFCVVSAGTYFLNDALDVEADRMHPTKCRRPIAAGTIGVRTAMTVGVGLMILAVGAAWLLTWRLSLVLAMYVGVQFAYSYYLKHQPVYDLVSVAAGFVLRAVAGAVAVGVSVSEWFLVVATFGSLLMVTGKRLGEHMELGEERAVHRASLARYTPSFLRSVLAASASGAMVGYALWALSLSTQTVHRHDAIWCELSIVPMFIALLKYAYLVDAGTGAKPEDLVLGDRSLQLLGLAWVVTFALGVYAH